MNPEDARFLVDGSDASSWTSRRPLEAGDFLELELPAELALGSVAYEMQRESCEPKLGIWTAASGEDLALVISARLRPTMDEQLQPYGQICLITPRPVRRVRIQALAATDKPWRISSLQLSERLR